jgi:hypothetical protein
VITGVAPGPQRFSTELKFAVVGKTMEPGISINSSPVAMAV